MKRTVGLMVFLTTVVILAACGSSRTIIDPPTKMTGQIIVVGNEPFTRLAVIVKPEKSYLINCDSTTRQLLMANQGKLADLVYDEIRKTNRGEELNVLSATIKTR